MTRPILLLASLGCLLALSVSAAEPIYHVAFEGGLGSAQHYYRIQEDREQISETVSGPTMGLGLERTLNDRADAGLWVHGWAANSDQGQRRPEFVSLQILMRGRWYPAGERAWVSLGGGLGLTKVTRDGLAGLEYEHDGVGWVGFIGAGIRLTELDGHPVGLGYELRAVDIRGDEDQNTGGTESFMHTVTFTYRAFSL